MDKFREMALDTTATNGTSGTGVVVGTSELSDKAKRFKIIVNELADLYARKNSDYGDSFGDTYRRFGMTSALIRLTDKYNRVCSLAKENKQLVNDESIKDTLLDMAAYAIMTVMEIENVK